MAIRKTISKKLRFEVFKRDSFTCQYCGQVAPNVILEVDHINPVANGGENEIMNLVTSCFDCNRGKGKREISDDSIIKKQKQQLDELNSRRLQLEMMIKWKEELKDLVARQVDVIENLLLESTGFGYSDHGRGECAKQIKEFGFSEVYESVTIAIDKYYRPDNRFSVTTTFKKIGGVCYNRRKKREEDGC